MHRLGAYGAMQVGEVLRREACLACRRMALRVCCGADSTCRIIGGVGVDDVESRRLESKGHEALIQLHPRLLDVPFHLLAFRILRQYAAERGRTSAMRLQK